MTQEESAPIPWIHCFLPSRYYAYCIVEPGQHTVAVYEIDNGFRQVRNFVGASMNADLYEVKTYYTGKISCSLASFPTIVQAEAGKNYYVKGFGGSAYLRKQELIPEAEGQALVKSCKLSGTGNLPH